MRFPLNMMDLHKPFLYSKVRLEKKSSYKYGVVRHTYDLSFKDSLLNQIMRSTMEKFEKKLKCPHESLKRIRQVGASPLFFQEKKVTDVENYLIVAYIFLKVDLPVKIMIISQGPFIKDVFSKGQVGGSIKRRFTK